MAIKRSTSIDTVLQAFGVMIIVLGLLAAIGTWPGKGVANQAMHALLLGNAIGYGLAGAVGGLCLVGFGVLIRVCDEIRGQNELALGDQEPYVEPVALGELPRGVIENDDGSFSVGDRTFKSLDSAEAYIDLVARAR